MRIWVRALTEITQCTQSITGIVVDVMKTALAGFLSSSICFGEGWTVAKTDKRRPSRGLLSVTTEQNATLNLDVRVQQ